MGRKDKLKKFAEVSEMDHVIEPSREQMFEGTLPLKGKWAKEHFGNDNPIVLELACGKGEYTLGLAERYPDRNFIGVDIKGNRIWKGAKTAQDKGMTNVAFLRTHIDSIHQFFGPQEVNDIWITFPDPQKKGKRRRKRLTHPLFLERYRRILHPSGTISLKTDSSHLFDFTMDTILEHGLEVIHQCLDVYYVGPDKFPDDLMDELEIKTFYERMWLEEGKTIKFIRFRPWIRSN